MPKTKTRSRQKRELIKYDRTCQGSIKIISIEKTFALHKSAWKKHFFLEFFVLKEALDEVYLIT